MRLSTILKYIKLSIRIGVYKRPYTSIMIFTHFLINRAQIKLKLKKLIIPPPNLVVSLTSRCNKTCSFCHYADELNSDSFSEDELSISRFKEILKSSAIPKYGRICLYGGEPLLNKDFFDILALANKRKYLTTIVTNGLLVSKYQEKMNMSGLSLITLSYYKEDIDKIKKSIIELSKNIPINVSYIISDARIEELDKMLQFSKDIKADMVTIENLRENGKTNEKSLFESSSLFEIQRKINKEYSKYFIIRWSGFNQRTAPKKVIKCKDIWDTIFLNAKGETSPCCQYPLSSYSGDIRDMSNSINSNEMINLRTKFINNEEPSMCKGCHYLYQSDPLYKS